MDVPYADDFVDLERRLVSLRLGAPLRRYLWTTLLSLIALLVVLPPFVPAPGAVAAVTAALVPCVVAALVTYYRGHPVAAAWTVLAASYVAFTATLWFFGGIRNPWVGAYVLLTVFGGYFLGFRAGVLFAAMSVGTAAVLWGLEGAGALPPPAMNLVPALGMCSMTAAQVLVVTHVLQSTRANATALAVVRQTTAQLQRSHRELEQEVAQRERIARELREERANLERTVALRTDALQCEVAERREAQRRMESAHAAAQNANRAKSEFLANMSHEIRTPLNAVIGMCSLLLETDLDDEQQEFTSTIRVSGEVLLALINDVLDFSKIDAGKLELERAPYSLTACIEDSLDLLSSLAAERGLRLRQRVSAEVPEAVIGDVTRVRQIVVNLVGNAIKFTREGEVEVRVDAEPVGAGRHRLHLRVRDTGVGIPRDRLEQIFDSFRQADASTTRKHGGSGLGLSICRRLCELMGGRIWAESAVGYGSTFHVQLEADAARIEDMTTPPRGRRRAPRVARAAGDRPLRILVAEDNSINQKVVLRMLQRLGHRADTVADGREALDALQRQPYDVVLMDVQMPQLDGIEATRALRLLDGIVQPRVIALTARASDEDRARCLDAGMDDYLTKPLRLDDLAGAVVRCQPRRLRAQPPPRRTSGLDVAALRALLDDTQEILEQSLEYEFPTVRD